MSARCVKVFNTALVTFALMEFEQGFSSELNRVKDKFEFHGFDSGFTTRFVAFAIEQMALIMLSCYRFNSDHKYSRTVIAVV